MELSPSLISHQASVDVKPYLLLLQACTLQRKVFPLQMQNLGGGFVTTKSTLQRKNLPRQKSTTTFFKCKSDFQRQISLRVCSFTASNVSVVAKTGGSFVAAK